MKLPFLNCLSIKFNLNTKTTFNTLRAHDMATRQRQPRNLRQICEVEDRIWRVFESYHVLYIKWIKPPRSVRNQRTTATTITVGLFRQVIWGCLFLGIWNSGYEALKFPISCLRFRWIYDWSYLLYFVKSCVVDVIRDSTDLAAQVY